MTGRRHDHGALRIVRGVLLAAASATLATTAHVLADGALPSAALTVVLTALIGWVSSALAERTPGALGVLGVLAPAQVVMHFSLTELAGHTAEHSGTGMVGDGWTMAAAHAFAVVASALLISHAERMLRLAVASLRLLLPVVWRPAPVPARALPRHVEPLLCSVSAHLRRAHQRRGPPAFS